MKKAILLLFFGAVVVALSFAIGQAESSASSASKTLPEVTVLINQSPWLAGFQAIAALYTKETGNSVKVEPVPFAAIIPKSMNATSASDSEYDILTLGEQMYVPFFAGGLVTPLNKIDPNFKLDPQVIEYNYVDRWDTTTNTSDKNGELYGVPINGNLQVLFYRTDLFAAKNLEPPKTWAEVEADAKILSNPPNVYGYVDRSSESQDWVFQAFLYGYGGSVAHRDASTGKWVV
ncbi:MAG TPA: extracellular solute-binding protein, partial [Spirochaetia bacterium]|nr:extracellular solute-binding protein [Spirochaetia bacterium]